MPKSSGMDAGEQRLKGADLPGKIFLFQGPGSLVLVFRGEPDQDHCHIILHILARKLGFDNAQSQRWTGEVEVIDIGLPRKLLAEFAK